MQLISQIKHSPPPSLRSLNRKVPYDLQTIIEKAMDSQPQRRYPTARDLADDLGRFYDGRPILARRVSSLEKLWLWSKKNVGLAAALATVLILLIAIAIGSSIAAIEFRASREVARKQSQLAYDTLNQVMFDIQQSLVEIPAASGARQRLLQTALEGLSKTSEQFIASNDTDRRLAVALQQLSSLALTTGASGDPDQSSIDFADRAARRAVTISRSVLDEQPNDPLAIRDMSISLNCFGAVQLAQGLFSEAREVYQRSIVLCQRNLTLNSNRSQALQDIATSWSALGRLESQALRHDVALEHYQAAHRHLLDLIAIDPDAANIQQSEAKALLNIGKACFSCEDCPRAQAQENLEAALERFQKLYDKQPNNVSAQRDLALVLESISRIYSATRNHAARLDACTRAYAIAKQMLEADPKNMDLMLGVAQSSLDLGSIQNTLDDSKSASQSFALACEKSEELYALYPETRAVRTMLCFSQTMVGQMTRDLGQYDQALTAFERAKQIAEMYTGDAESGEFFLGWALEMDGLIADTIDRRESGHPPEYWLERPPGLEQQEN